MYVCVTSDDKVIKDLTYIRAHPINLATSTHECHVVKSLYKSNTSLLYINMHHKL